VTSEPECRSWVEQDEGPYHHGGEPFRHDISEDRDGVALQLGVRLVGADGTPVVGAVVDVWHCDALGRYSGFGRPGEAAHNGGSAEGPEEHFLRGRQRTDPAGRCEFRTIYPGWYGGRTVHIHVIAESDGRRSTSQFFFPDALTDAVHTRPPYAQRAARDTTNTTDDIFAHQGEQTTLMVIPDGEGYRASICLVLGEAPADG